MGPAGPEFPVGPAGPGIAVALVVDCLGKLLMIWFVSCVTPFPEMLPVMSKLLTDAFPVTLKFPVIVPPLL